MQKEIYWRLRQGEIIREMYSPTLIFKQLLTFGLYKRKRMRKLQKEFDELHKKIMSKR